MKNQKGFTLIELLIVIVIIGIIAAIAIPSLLRARVSANESGMIGDTRTVISAQATYASANANMYTNNLGCLSTPAQGTTCIPSYSTAAPTFLDPNLGRNNGPKSGYQRSFLGVCGSGSCVISSGTVLLSGSTAADQYAFLGSPVTANRTGVRAFCGADDGVICFDAQGSTSTIFSGNRCVVGCASIQ